MLNFNIFKVFASGRPHKREIKYFQIFQVLYLLIESKVLLMCAMKFKQSGHNI